jgi:xanthine/uracil permease
MGLRMLHPLFRTLVKVIFASLIVGTVMTQFGITVDQVMRETGMSPETKYARQGFAWALPNVLLGALVIVPIWFVVFLFRPPGKSSSD